MDGFVFSSMTSGAKAVIASLAAVVIAGVAGIGYAVHEHQSAQALEAQRQALTQQSQQITAQLNNTQSQAAALSAKVNALTTNNEPNMSGSSTGAASRRPSAAHRAVDPRFNKLQSQLDAQGKEIDQARSDLADTRNDLTSTRTELTGSIAHTHDELVVLEKRGERNYVEFDILKTKEFKHEGPISIRLSKANAKKGYADLLLIVDDRNLTQKHINLYQPAMFYAPDSPQPIEVVINDISKDHIHGYVSAPKYHKSELDAMTSASANPAPASNQAANSSQNTGQGDSDIVGAAPFPDHAANSSSQPAVRQRLSVPSEQPSQQ